ncbi:MAG: HAMP domain-containing protein [Chloroflexi bacterium]|nr:HAMP domain-containing protein [Chloroflexota bacterium]
MKSSLRTRLILSFVLIIVSAVGSFSLVGRSTINQWFNRMMLQSGREYASRAAQIFGWYYVTNGSWDGVENLWIDFRQFSNNRMLIQSGGSQWQIDVEPPQGAVPGELTSGAGNIMPPRDERLLLVDANGGIIYDSNPDAGSADTLLANMDVGGVQIRVEDEIVGTVIAASSAGILNTFQEAFLHNVNTFVLLGGIGAMLVAIGFGAWLSVGILRPVKALSQASHKLAEGDYSQRIPVTTDDELGEMTQSFNHMAAELEDQEMLRRRSLADVAHELRTPLSVLQIELESIEDGITEPDAETIQRLQLEVGTLRKLVEDLRILSLADAGELKLDFQPVDIDGLLHINVKRMERQAKEKGVTIIEDLTQADLQVLGDEQRLSQVFLNLLSNALQYTAAGGTILAKSEHVGGQARVSITDTGTGIAAEDIPHIFERLYRSDGARARQNGGSGLGLSIARSLVLAHGGKIWAESVEGEGSTFSLELPLLQE